MIGNLGGGSRTQCSHHATLINYFVVCMSLRLFGHVEGFSQVPRCFPRMNILSRIPGMIVSQGIPCVRGFRLSRILLCHLSPQGVGLQNLAHVRQSLDRSIREKHGRHHESSRSVVVGGSKQVERLLGRFQMVLLVWELTSSLGSGDVGSFLPATLYRPLSMEQIL